MAFLGIVGHVETGAAQDAGTGFELGARVGYGVPLGKTADDASSDMDEAISGQVPLWLDVGYRVTPEVMVGAYFSYGFGFLGSGFDDLCDAADSCSTSDVRLGAQVQYHIQPGEKVDPWLGAGIGYEWLTFSAEAGDTELSTTGSGFEFLNLQAGLDFPVGQGGGIGPFAGFTLGQYDQASNSCSGVCTGFDEDSEDIEEKALHHWLFFGVRGTFVL